MFALLALAACGSREPGQPVAVTGVPLAEGLPTATPKDGPIAQPAYPLAPAPPSYPGPAPTSPPYPGLYPAPQPLLAATPAPTIPPVPGQDGPPLARSALNTQVSPDGRYAVYNADDDGDRVRDLISLPLDGGPPVQLSTVPAPPDTFFSFAISPDSSTVVYHARSGPLLRVSILGGPSTQLAANALKFRISPDSQWVVFWEAAGGLYSAPLAGGQAVSLGDGPSQSGSFAISADSARVVFTQGTFPEAALYSASIRGGGLVLLSVAAGAQPVVREFAITPDGGRVLFSWTETGDGRDLSLLSAPIAGRKPTLLWDGRQGEPLRDGFRPSADGSLALFAAGPPGGGVQQYAVPVSGGSAAPLGERLADAGGIVSPAQARDRVLYIARQPGDRSPELYSAPIAGGPAVRLSGPHPFDGGWLLFQAAPRTGRVVFAADLDLPGEVRLYSAPTSGEGATLLSDGLPPGVRVSFFTVSDDGTLAVFGVAQAPPSGSPLPNLAAVYAAHTDGSATWEILGGGNIQGFQLLPDRRLLYQSGADGAELRVISIGGP